MNVLLLLVEVGRVDLKNALRCVSSAKLHEKRRLEARRCAVNKEAPGREEIVTLRRTQLTSALVIVRISIDPDREVRIE